jgi:hypothetical protein
MLIPKATGRDARESASAHGGGQIFYRLCKLQRMDAAKKIFT